MVSLGGLLRWFAYVVYLGGLPMWLAHLMLEFFVTHLNGLEDTRNDQKRHDNKNGNGSKEGTMGQKTGHFEISIIHFLTSERCERTSERTSEKPSTARVYSLIPQLTDDWRW